MYIFSTSSAVRCFKWKVRQCSDETKCELQEGGRPSGSIDVSPHGETYLLSPGFQTRVTNQSGKQLFGRRYFCIYNVSMSCPSRSVTVQKTDARTTWPGTTSAEDNYVAFYTNSSAKSTNYIYKDSSTPFSRTLHSDSFIAIMWSNKNKGHFEFTASCNPVEGSGDEETNLVPGIQQG